MIWDVVNYVKKFQGLIDHYLIGTTVLNTKIYQGPRYGHFFIMPEDNLIHLYEGTRKVLHERNKDHGSSHRGPHGHDLSEGRLHASQQLRLHCSGRLGERRAC